MGTTARTTILESNLNHCMTHIRRAFAKQPADECLLGGDVLSARANYRCVTQLRVTNLFARRIVEIKWCAAYEEHSQKSILY